VFSSTAAPRMSESGRALFGGVSADAQRSPEATSSEHPPVALLQGLSHGLLGLGGSGSDRVRNRNGRGRRAGVR
jgi:hypothetical protein